VLFGASVSSLVEWDNKWQLPCLHRLFVKIKRDNIYQPVRNNNNYY
jgi:hypothetical protein